MATLPPVIDNEMMFRRKLWRAW